MKRHMTHGFALLSKVSLIAVILLASCDTMFGEYTNPADPDSSAYSGEPAVRFDQIALVTELPESAVRLPALTANKVVGATSYELQVATDSGFASVEFAHTSGSKEVTTNETDLSRGPKYLRLRAHSESQTGEWSDVHTIEIVYRKVSYDGNGADGGSVPTDLARYTSGASVTVAGNSGTLVRTDYYFAGWNTQADGDGTDYAVGSSLTMGGADVVLYAKWADPALEGYVYVEGGTFQMGSTSGDSDESPLHSVTVSDFYMAEHEVTQGQWETLMGSNPASGYGVGSTYPVYYVSWYNVLVYANRLSIQNSRTPVYSIGGSTDPDDWGSVPTSSNSTWNSVSVNWSANGYRLPTEAEWEFAARGGNQSQGYTYSGSNTAGDVAWYDGNAGGRSHEVKTKAPNELGLYDMSGNLWEWTWDWYGSYSSSAQSDPTGPSSGADRVERGGYWSLSTYGLRSAYRGNGYPYFRNGYVGFRLVCR